MLYRITLPCPALIPAGGVVDLIGSNIEAGMRTGLKIAQRIVDYRPALRLYTGHRAAVPIGVDCAMGDSCVAQAAGRGGGIDHTQVDAGLTKAMHCHPVNHNGVLPYVTLGIFEK